MIDFRAAQGTVMALIEAEADTPRLEWTLQGFGMLRLYLTADRSVRLHVWDDRYRVPGVSETHTHPWNMRSTVVAGTIENVRYQERPRGTHRGSARGLAYSRQSILCGVGGGLEGEPSAVELLQYAPEEYEPGDSYEQWAHEIHVSRPARSAVTVVERTFGSDVDHAYVYWPAGTKWVSAEPRRASAATVGAILGSVLSNR